jgi:protein-L-isoaspartate(D-aspartate) O-methyltransferase
MSRIATQTQMVDQQLVRRGITDQRVLAAFRSVPREAFVPKELIGLAYSDAPLPIEDEQTISQPYIVAFTAQLLGLSGQERVLEVGTGSGYAAAIFSQLAREVYTVERFEDLAAGAAERLLRLGYGNVQVQCADGTLGWLEHAPYDAIAVAAASPEVPPALLAQLGAGGRLIIPVGGRQTSQMLVRISRDGSGFRREELAEVRFVPLVGEQGWPEKPSDGS